MKYVLVNNDDIVVNIIEWDGVLYNPETGAGWTPPNGLTPHEADNVIVGIGWNWNDGEPINLNPSEPMMEVSTARSLDERRSKDLKDALGKGTTAQRLAAIEAYIQGT